MRILMAGAAAIALAASPAVFAQGNGNGNGQGNGRGASQEDRADRAEERRERRQERREEARDRAADRRDAARDRAEDRQDNRQDWREERRDRIEDRRDDFRDRVEDRRDTYRDRVEDRRDDWRDGRADRRYSRDVFDWGWLARDRDRDLVRGCPPGLAKKRNGCNPPGQLRDRGERNYYGYDYRPSLFGLRNYDSRGEYYYRDGYLVRYGDRGGIASWLPLLGGALGIGNVWPSGYSSYEVPDYYVDYYNLGGPDRYRYADNVIYRVDPRDAAITSIAALITGDEFVIGQPAPRGYDVYNVPYAFREQYYDTPDRLYRYSDGYVYEIDPETRLVAAAIDLLI